jgi:hypothetical protein
MKRLLLFALLAVPLLSQAQVDFNVTIGNPGYNGRIYLDNGQQPEIMNQTPIIAYPGPSNPYVQPIYLLVPRYVYRNWPRYCRYYGADACYTPIYFVQDYWYQRSYIPWYRNRYPYDVPRHRNRYPYDVPKYAPRGGTMWHGETPVERYQRNSNEVEIQRDENR